MRYRAVDQIVQRQCTANCGSPRRCAPKNLHLNLKCNLQNARLSSSTASTAESPKLPKLASTDHMRNTAKFRDLVSLLWKVVEEKRLSPGLSTTRNITTNAEAQENKAEYEVVHKEVENAASAASTSTQVVDKSEPDSLLETVQPAPPETKSINRIRELVRGLPAYLSIALNLRHRTSVAATSKSPPPVSTEKPESPSKQTEQPEIASPPKLDYPYPTVPKFKSGTFGASRESADGRTRYLLKAVATASSLASRSTRLQEFCQHLYDNPQAKSLAIKEKGVPLMMRLKIVTKDPTVQGYINEALALLGYIRPLPGRGIRILAIDGGGTRGIMAIEILRALEEVTRQPVHRLFDYICGVSTGSILTMLLGALKLSMDECEEIYKRASTQIFTQNALWGTGSLVLSHAFYDTAAWSKVLQQTIGEIPLIQTARDPTCPKIAAISTVVNQPRLLPFIFRNYDYPHRYQSSYPGLYTPLLWESVRASAAAPGYFEEIKLGDYIHQDGGVLANNPTALAIHECRHLWPKDSIQCVVSIGNGRYEPQVINTDSTSSSLKTKLLKIVDSATDTEAVHTILNDLLPPSRYYRFNPYLSAAVSLDEIRPEKFKQLHDDAQMYLRKNEQKLHRSAEMLMEPRGFLQKMNDDLKLKIATYV